jgi:dolichol-phosphate mannosyltransferase
VKPVDTAEIGATSEALSNLEARRAFRGILSIVAPCFNEAGNVEALYKEILDAASGLNWELVLVDDGSADTTFERIKSIAKADPRVRGFRLSRNFGHQYALLAGLQRARGAVIVTMDADLQHPPALIPKLLDEWRTGFNIVHTRRQSEGELTWFKKWTSAAYYRVFSLLCGVRIEEGASDFRLLDRRVADAMLSMQEAEMFMRGLVAWMGYKNTFVSYRVRPRLSGSSKYGVGKMLRFAFAGITSFSTIPLRVGIFLGFATSILAVGEIGYVIWMKLRGQVVPGWASITAVMSFLFACAFVLIGLLGIYVGHIFRRVQHHPTFFVEEGTDAERPPRRPEA